MTAQTIKTKKVTIGSLSFDDELVYIRPISPFTVSKYRQAMRAGAVFPSIVITTDNVIVCGAHRVTAYREEFGEDYEITAVVEKYKDRREMVERFASDNSVHGLPLTGFQRRAIALKLSALGSKPEEIANLFGVSVNRIQEWAGQSVYVIGDPSRKPAITHYKTPVGPAPTAAPIPAATDKKELMPIKRSISQIAGSIVQSADYEFHKSNDIGSTDKDLADQLTRHIYLGWVSKDDYATLTSIAELFQAIKSAGLDKMPVEQKAQ